MFPGHSSEGSGRPTEVKYLLRFLYRAVCGAGPLAVIASFSSLEAQTAPAPTPITLPSGLSYLDEGAGTGVTVAAGRLVTARYVGKWLDGKIFDSSHAEGRPPFSFVQGTTRLLPGWTQGVEGMREGGKRIVTLPSSLAYGTDGVRGFIPPAAPLVYEIEVLKVE